LLALSPLLLLTGCLPMQLFDSSADESSPMVPSSPFGTSRQVVTKPISTNFAPAAWESAMRVDRVSKVILASNPKIGCKPLFGTIGDPRPEIFHQGAHAIQITEGMVNKCKDDGELAAVLCLELGKMVSERETLAGAKARALQEQLPLGVAVGNSGGTGPSDMVAVAELANYEEQRKQHARRHVRPPEPKVLACGYLEKTGFGKRQLDAVAPLLEAAEKNYVFEKQFKGSANTPSWSPVTPQ
jgi:hypothetical protein